MLDHFCRGFALSFVHGFSPCARASAARTTPVHRQWSADNRRFAPWHYEEAAMMRGDDNRYYVPPPLRVKERLHHYPDGYTKHQAATTQDRRRLLGNSWHLGVARLILTLMMTQLGGTAATNITRAPHQCKHEVSRQHQSGVCRVSLRTWLRVGWAPTVRTEVRPLTPFEALESCALCLPHALASGTPQSTEGRQVRDF